jgi:two-component sensor histidine kinase
MTTHKISHKLCQRYSACERTSQQLQAQAWINRMNENNKPHTTRINLFPGSIEFWICNFIGWICFIYANSMHAYFYGGIFYSALINSALMAILGTFTLLCFRYFYFKQAWQQQHPMKLVPLLCLLSIFFSATATILTYSVLNGSISITDLFEGTCISPNSQPWFGAVVGYFNNYVYIMLGWLLFYVLIQAEKKEYNHPKPSIRSTFIAALSLLVVHQTLHIFSTIAYYNPEGFLFSFYYFSGNLWTIIFSLLLSLYVFLLKPREKVFRSKLLPIVPLLIVLVFFSSVFSMWAFILIPVIPELVTNTHIEDIAPKLMLTFNEKTPPWGTAGAFSGLLYGKFTEQFIMALFLLYCNFSRTRRSAKNSPLSENFNVGNSLQFWLYNLGGWSTAGIYLYFSDLLEIAQAGHNISQAFILSFILIGAFLGSMLRGILQQMQLHNSSLIVSTCKIVSLSFLFGVLQACALTMVSYIYIYGVLGDQAIASKQHIFNGSYYFYKTLAWFSLCYVIWSLIYELSISQRNKSLNALKQLQLERNVKELQLNTLAGKIDPHFIFNALNNIRALIREDTEKARAAILILSDILRSPITKDTRDRITVMDELILVRNYIALSKIQLEHRLDYQEKLSEDSKLALIPPMMLQILVENAIKHGISQQPDGGSLTVIIYKTKDLLLCQVINSGSLHKESTTKGFGVGIKNITERLALLYDNKASFHLAQENQKVIAELAFPLEYRK